MQRYILFIRMKRAAYRHADSVTAIALDAGYIAPMKTGAIPGGRCAAPRVVVGHTDNLEPAALDLYRDWLLARGKEARDFALRSQRFSPFPEGPEHEAVAELLLPLREPLWPTHRPWPIGAAIRILLRPRRQAG